MQDILLALLMGALTAQSQSKRLFMSCFLSDAPVAKYVSIESVENANIEIVQKSIEDAFGGFICEKVETYIISNTHCYFS